MSTLEEMKQQLLCYQKDLESMKPLANHYFEIADLENAIWTLQKRIREAEYREKLTTGIPMKNLDPEIVELVNKNFWDLLDETKEQGE